jgi:membrane-associated phospholipid phosphatase
MVGDAHYFSDVLIGAVVGTSIGLGVPLLHHYKRAASEGPPTSGLGMTLVPGLNGVQLLGTF